jgi:hypothetical protein
VLRTNLRWKLVSQLVRSCLGLMLVLTIASCDGPSTATNPSLPPVTIANDAMVATDGPLSEVNTPSGISKIAPALAKFQPQVQILSPKFDEVLSDDEVTVKLQVDNFPLFKNPELGLGNHLHVILDKQTYQGVYDLTQPLVFKNLTPGTHSLRVFASRPWHESFKNEGAYDRVTFHVLTKTAENNPDPQKPLLTYSRPSGTYGAEPIMLDYYLTNAPSHPATDGSQTQIPDWRIRVTVNEQRFILDRWAPIYLEGFKLGKNLVRLELLDDRGNPIPNVYNDSIGVFDYNPQTKDTLAKLVGGKLTPDLARTLVDPNYIVSNLAPNAVPAPSVDIEPPSKPAPKAAPINIPSPIVTAPQPTISPSPTPIPSVKPSPSPIAVTPPPAIAPSPSPILVAPPPAIAPSPNPIAINPLPVAIPSPNPIAINSPPVVKPSPSPIAIQPPVSIPTLAPKLQPTIAPKLPDPIATPSIETPVATKPQLVETPRPEIAKQQKQSRPTQPLGSQPEPIVAVNPAIEPPAPQVPPSKPVIPQPEITKNPIASAAPQPPVSAPKIVPQASSNPIPIDLAPIQIENPNSTTWQTRAIDLLNAGKAKIRQFTNTIPAKAQRFARNLRTWTSYAIDKVQELRNRDIGNNPKP